MLILGEFAHSVLGIVMCNYCGPGPATLYTNVLT